MHSSFAILADDLTGAADCAARCFSAGLPALLRYPTRQAPIPPGMAVAYSSESRFLPPEQAATAVKECLALLPRHAGLHWYKKIDSTLRGQIGAELVAMLASLHYQAALIAPAFPAQGRMLRAGWLVTNQNHAPVSLPMLLAQQTGWHVAAIALADVRAGPDVLAATIERHAQTARLLVVDAETEHDLATIAAAIACIPAILACGSAGLIQAIAARYRVTEATPGSIAPAGSALLVVGSASPRAQAQIAFLREQGIAACSTPDTPDQSGAAITLVSLPTPPPDFVLDSPEARSMVGYLADYAQNLLNRCMFDLLILVGGDTSAAMLERLGITELCVIQELLPGIALMQGCDARGTLRTLILKPGSFGDVDTLYTLLVHQGLVGASYGS